MLRFLSIRHLAVIDALDVEFSRGLTVLTGETGAGKSILVEAVGLLLGGRASGDLVRTGEDQATLQAIFENGGDELILRREIGANGRSRAFINDTLATAGALKDLAARLVELHGQHEHQALLDPANHLPMLDRFAGTSEAADATSGAWTALAAARDELARCRRDADERRTRLDFLTFQLQEIAKVGPKAGEDEELLTTRQVLASAEKLERLCQESYAALYESDDALLSGLAGVFRRVGELAALDPKFAPFVEMRESIKSPLEDLAFFLRSYAENIDASPARLQQVEDRLAQLERLKRKYGPLLADVLARQASLGDERDRLESAGERLADLERALEECRGRFLAQASSLSAARRAAAPRLAAALERLLAELAMERTRFEVRFEPGPLPESRWSDRGIDEAEFFVSPNPGEDLRPLARIVSGGELSRIMLALKTLASTDAPGKTLIFDEVDAGIGGRVAEVVGRKLKGLGLGFQVFCITHLPQIAAYGSEHLLIAKHVRQGRTLTTIERLAGERRVEELGRMLGGSQLTPQLLTAARELLNSRLSESEAETKGESETPPAKTRPGRTGRSA